MPSTFNGWPIGNIARRFKHLRVNITKPQIQSAPGPPKAASNRTALGATLNKRPPSSKTAMFAKAGKGPLPGLGDNYFGLECLDLAAQKSMDARGKPSLSFLFVSVWGADIDMSVWEIDKVLTCRGSDN